MSRKKRDASSPDTRRFVQVGTELSVGVEVSTGRAWVGVDQQVGHGSADALFALTDEQYATALLSEWELRSFIAECWRGEHNNLRLFEPAGGAWRPENWSPSRSRVMPPPFAGELWWHIDALTHRADDEEVIVSGALSGNTARIATDADDVVDRIQFRLLGDAAYPRPRALIAGLAAGSSRELARVLLGDLATSNPDEFLVEGVRLRLGYDGDALEEITLERLEPVPSPGGHIGVLLAALGEPEQGPAFRAVARRAGERSRRWAASSGIGRRLITFDGGVDLLVEKDRVLAVRVSLDDSEAGTRSRNGDELFPGVSSPPTRKQLHSILGAPIASHRSTDMYRYDGRRDLLIAYGSSANDAAPTEITAVLGGASVSFGFNRWRSGEFTLFLDVLGRAESNALVGFVRRLPGVKLGTRHGVVSEVEIGRHGYQTERYAAFVDGMPGEPMRKDIPFGVPNYTGDHDDVRDFVQGWIHVRSADGLSVSSIRVSEELERGLDVHQWMAHRDR